MMLSNRMFIWAVIVLICVVQSGCALFQLPFQLLGAAVGAAGQAAQVGMAVAPKVAPLLLL